MWQPFLSECLQHRQHLKTPPIRLTCRVASVTTLFFYDQPDLPRRSAHRPKAPSPGQVADQQRETAQGTVWLSPTRHIYDQHMRAYGSAAVGSTSTDPGNAAFLRQHCRSLLLPLLEENFPERVQDVDAILNEYRGLEERLCTMLAEEMAKTNAQKELRWKTREKKVASLARIL
eukprot:PhM_4_TR2843/c0_g1_i1/m.36953